MHCSVIHAYCLLHSSYCHHTGMGSNLVQGREDFCAQSINYNGYICNIFHYFNKQTLLLLLSHQQYYIYTYIILTKTCKILHC